MQITVDARNPAEVAADLLVVPVAKLSEPRPRLPARAAALDRRLGGALAAVIASGDFSGKAGESQLVYPRNAGRMRARAAARDRRGGEARRRSAALRRRQRGRARPPRARPPASSSSCPRCASCARPRSPRRSPKARCSAGYRFDTYARGGDDAPGRVSAFTLCLERGGDLRAARSAARIGVIGAESQNLARQLSNEPANALPPAALALAPRSGSRRKWACACASSTSPR